MSGEDFSVSLDQERHDLAAEAQQVADDAEETSPAHAVAVALDVLTDAQHALTQAGRACRVARAAYEAAQDAEARS